MTGYQPQEMPFWFIESLTPGFRAEEIHEMFDLCCRYVTEPDDYLDPYDDMRSNVDDNHEDMRGIIGLLTNQLKAEAARQLPVQEPAPPPAQKPAQQQAQPPAHRAQQSAQNSCLPSLSSILICILSATSLYFWYAASIVPKADTILKYGNCPVQGVSADDVYSMTQLHEVTGFPTQTQQTLRSNNVHECLVEYVPTDWSTVTVNVPNSTVLQVYDKTEHALTKIQIIKNKCSPEAISLRQNTTELPTTFLQKHAFLQTGMLKCVYNGLEQEFSGSLCTPEQMTYFVGSGTKWTLEVMRDWNCHEGTTPQFNMLVENMLLKHSQENVTYDAAKFREEILGELDKLQRRTNILDCRPGESVTILNPVTLEIVNGAVNQLIKHNELINARLNVEKLKEEKADMEAKAAADAWQEKINGGLALVGGAVAGSLGIACGVAGAPVAAAAVALVVGLSV